MTYTSVWGYQVYIDEYGNEYDNSDEAYERMVDDRMTEEDSSDGSYFYF